MPELFSICQGLSREPGAPRVRFRREPTSLTFLRGKYERKLFLKSQKLFLKSWKLFLKYFLNPRNYFLIWAPNPETIYKTRIAFTNPNHWTRIAVNHLKSRDCPRQVSHVLTERERLPGCWRRRPFILFRSMFILFRSMFFDSSSQNQSLFLSYFSICKEFQYVIMCLYVSIFVNLGFIYLYWYIVLLDDLRHSKGITETVSNRFPLLAR